MFQLLSGNMSLSEPNFHLKHLLLRVLFVNAKGDPYYLHILISKLSKPETAKSYGNAKESAPRNR
jgi:hypothetical protein